MAEIYVRNLPAGTKLQGGKYEIVRFINSGGFGCTYEAWFPMLHTRVAIKEFFMGKYCVRDQKTGNVSVPTDDSRALVEKCRLKFVDEASTLYGMSHRSIVRVADIFEENGTAYFAMDYISGRTLAEIVKAQGPMAERKAIDCILQICEALQYLHSKNRLHLDIKPDNIMVDDTGRAVLIDFGASKYLDNATREEKKVTSSVVQTVGFTPNEQLTGEVSRFTNATDLYALGATLYYVLSGKVPASGTLRAAGEDLDPLPDGISRPTRLAVEKAMNMAKADRPQTAKEFADMLRGGVSAKPDNAKPAEADGKTVPLQSAGKAAKRETNDAKEVKPEVVRESKPEIERGPVQPNRPSVFDIPGKKSGNASGFERDRSTNPFASKQASPGFERDRSTNPFSPAASAPQRSAQTDGKKRKTLIGAIAGAVVLIGGGIGAIIGMGGKEAEEREMPDPVVLVEELTDSTAIAEVVPVESQVEEATPVQEEKEEAADKKEEEKTELKKAGSNKEDAPAKEDAKKTPEAANSTASNIEAEASEPAKPTAAQLLEQEYRQALSHNDHKEKQRALLKLAEKDYAPAYAPLATISVVLGDNDTADKYARLAIDCGNGAKVKDVVNMLDRSGYYDNPAHGSKPKI